MTDDSNGSPYVGWDLYMNQSWEKFISDKDASNWISVLELFIVHFKESESLLAQVGDPDNVHSVPLDFKALHAKFSDENFATAMRDRPTEMISIMGLALYQVINASLDTPVPHKINARIYNYEPITPLKMIKSPSIGKLVAIRGTVVRVANIKPLVTAMVFRCPRCGMEMFTHLKDGKYRMPEKCSSASCKSRNFDPLPDTAVTVDWQKIKLQELPEGNDPGRVPRSIEVELTDDQVDCCVPGDIVTIVGQVKISKVSGGYSKKSDISGKAMFAPYIDANSLGNSKQGDSGKLELMQFSVKEIKGIQAIIMAPDVLGLIVKSICPSIYGNHLVKAGLALSLFGGTQKMSSNNSKIATRGDIHLLLVGDPGLGKSQLLQAVVNIAPRSVYVCGSYSTTSGLTVTLLRDSTTGDYALEAGALVLGDQGVCCIDEFDKMKHEHEALLEAMEQQSVSIAKAGIVCNLPARTAVIAAANPAGGHYDKSKTVSENIKMSTALLSRFDLVFILLDRPDHQRDQLLSDHVMSKHRKKDDEGDKKKSYFVKDENMEDDILDPADTDLLSRLIHTPRYPSPIEPRLLRKYIGYAKKYCPDPKTNR